MDIFMRPLRRACDGTVVQRTALGEPWAPGDPVHTIADERG